MKKKIYITILIIIVSIISIFLLIEFKGPTSYQKRIYNDNNLISKEGDSYYSSLLLENNNEISLKDFTGSYTIWQIDKDNNFNLNVSFENKVKSGKLKIVLIKDNIFYKNILDNNIDYNLSSGKYRIKIVGLYNTSDIKYEIKVSS